MKKNVIRGIPFIIVILLGFVIWMKIPVKMMDLDPTQVSEIHLFDGNTGRSLSVTNEQEIQQIVDNLNAVTLTKEKISLGYMGYSFRTNIYLENGKKAKGFNDFIISSSGTVRKDPFFYNDQAESINYDFIKSLFDEEN